MKRRAEFFMGQALAGVMGHARADNPPDVLAKLCLGIGLACDRACDDHDDAEEKREEAERGARKGAEREETFAENEARRIAREKEDAELEAATAPAKKDG